MGSCEELYIITGTGICLYSKTRGKEFDKTLFAGLMSALNTFSMRISANSIRSFALKNATYVIAPENDLLFVARMDPQAKDFAVNADLQEMQKIFFETVSPEILASGGDLDAATLQALDQRYAPFLLEADEKMRSALW